MLWIGRRGRGLRACAAVAAVAALFFAASAAGAQNTGGNATQQVKERSLTSHFPDKTSQTPTVSIPVEPLGFSAPGLYHLTTRSVMASLDFVDENRLLFTFRFPGLLHRDMSGSDSDERQIRAVVLSLPQGAVEAETTWTLHDRSRYLWMLNNGHFLLRDRKILNEGDATLSLKPWLDFPGPLLAIDLDPEQQYVVANSREPAAPGKKAGQGADAAAAADAQDQAPDHRNGGVPDLVLRVLRRATGEVKLVSRVRSIVHLPINSTGFVEPLRGDGKDWLLNLREFNGGVKSLGRVESTCTPTVNFLTAQAVFIAGCIASGDSRLMVMTASGRTLWMSRGPDNEIWPSLTLAANGQRLAWTTLVVNSSIDSFAPLSVGDVKEQLVTVLDSATGDIALVSPLNPILNGGNVAISPSGRRVALINAGAIQVFDLPPAPSLPVVP